MLVIRKVLLTAVAVSLTVGLILGAVLSANLLATRSLSSSADSKNQIFALTGTETIKVLAPNGHVISTWHGPDPLSSNVKNAIAGCATGVSQPSGAVPYGVFNSCEDWIGSISLWIDGPGSTCTVTLTANSKYCSFINGVTATNTLTPIGCTTGGPGTAEGGYGTCTGWITDATFGPTTFTSANCGSSCSVEYVEGASPLGWAFDYVCASTFAPGEPSVGCLSTSIATVVPLDSLLVTIQFNVS
ncbi:MAG: hypothetical protein ACYCPW_03815 [Nitrososphaerales archaeon]